MKLKSIEIHGFKSFAQRTELSFDKGITGIVGPNGSGKSNIADAVRWVLGEQSARLLRGSKMEDVIFGGTQRRRALPYCEVSLLFDNEDQALNSPYAEVLVTRRAYRSGEGEYFLNRTNCRLKDILALFRDTGIGKEGYSIIGQGRVEEILSTRGEERRLVFEEAAGIVTYRVRKEEAERQLARTNDNLLRLKDILDELGTRLPQLEEQAAAAREYLSLSERLKALELNSYLIRHDKLTGRIASLCATAEDLIAASNTKEAQLALLKHKQTTLEIQLEQVETRDQEARTALAIAQDALGEEQAARASQQNRLEKLNEDIQRVAGEAREAEENLREISNILKGSDLEEQEQTAALGELEQLCAQEEERLSILIIEAGDKETALGSKNREYITALNRLNDTKAAQARNQLMLSQLEKRHGELTEDLDKLAAQAEEAERALLLARENETNALALCERMEEEVKLLKSQVLGAEEAVLAGQKAAQQLQAQQAASKSRLQILEDMQRDYDGYHQAVKLALQHAGSNPRVHGVVADIMDVDERFETALEMILGGTLQHIVTDDEDVAKELIDYLRSNRLGRTTFLPISAIRPRTLTPGEKQLLKQQGAIGIASELVRYQDKYRPIIENILGRTAIVADLEAAIRLSRAAGQAFSVVTLAGDVIRAGGAMTGGTSRAQTSSLLGRQREISKLKELLVKLERSHLESTDSLRAETSRAADFRKLLGEASHSLSQERIAQAREQERARNAKSAYAEVIGRRQDVTQALEQILQAKKEVLQDLQSAGETLNGDALDQDKLATLMEEMQAELSQQRRLVETQRKRLAEVNEKRTQQLHWRDSLARDRRRLEKELTQLEGKHHRALDQVSSLEESAAQALAVLASIEEKLKQREQAFSDAAQENRESVDERKQLVRLQADLRHKTESLHQELAVDREKLHKNELVQAKAESELQTLDEYILNSYNLTYTGAQEFQTEVSFDLSKGEAEARSIKQQIRDMGMINVGAIEEYALIMHRHKSLDSQRMDALKAKDDLEGLIQQLLSRMESQFLHEFRKLNEHFSQTFSRLFGGGDAELRLSDPAAPLSCDIEVAAQPPGKKLQLLSLLSGGERALTAIAILFAMLKLKPTPFCILDEIEAALDDANIAYFADYLAEYAASTQFVVITHRKGTMERCDALYGVAMEEKGISSMVSVDLQRFA